MYEIKKKSVIPIYAAGLVFSIYPVLFPLYRLTDFLIYLAVSAIVYTIVSALTTKRTVLSENIQKTNTSADSIIKDGMDTIVKIRETAAKIKKHETKNDLTAIINQGVNIFEYLSQHPEQLRKINTFLEYYLPMTLKLTLSYYEFESRDIASFSETLTSIENSIAMIRSAYEKQLEALLSDKSLDIITDIKVLEQTLKMEGLDIDGKNFR